MQTMKNKWKDTYCSKYNLPFTLNSNFEYKREREETKYLKRWMHLGDLYIKLLTQYIRKFVTDKLELYGTE